MKPPSVIRISKATVKAWAASFATLIAVGVLALIIVDAIPSTPFAQIQRFATDSNNNSAIYDSGLFQTNAPLANFLDGVVITGLSFLVAGLPYGWIAARAGQRPAPMLRGAAACALFLSALIVGLGWWGVAALSRDSYLSGGLAPPTLLPNLDFWKTAVVQVAFWTAAFLAGAYGTSLLPRRAPGAAAKQAPIA